jgi:hypothetical protein
LGPAQIDLGLRHLLLHRVERSLRLDGGASEDLLLLGRGREVRQALAPLGLYLLDLFVGSSLLQLRLKAMASSRARQFETAATHVFATSSAGISVPPIRSASIWAMSARAFRGRRLSGSPEAASPLPRRPTSAATASAMRNNLVRPRTSVNSRWAARLAAVRLSTPSSTARPLIDQAEGVIGIARRCME